MKNKTYMSKIILKRNAENVTSICKNHYYLIPLTRFADRIFSHLLSLGVDKYCICRSDELIVGRIADGMTVSGMAVG